MSDGCLVSYTTFAQTLSYTNSFTISTDHSLSPAIGIGASSTNSDGASGSLPLFSPDGGILTGISLQVQSANPTFEADVSTALNLIGITVGCTLTQQLAYTVSALPASAAGPVVGPVGFNIVLPIGQTSAVLTTNPATISSTLNFSNPSDLAAFTGAPGPAGAGNFSVNATLDSTYSLGAVSLLTTLAGHGSYPLKANVTYTYGPHSTPSVSTGKTNGNVVISWPSYATNYELQSATNLLAPQWVIVTNGITYSGGAFHFTGVSSTPQMYFRLVQVP